MKKISILLVFILIVGCQKQDDKKSPVVAERQEVRKDIQEWIDKDFGDRVKLKKAVEDLAKTPPESCDFKYKVECVEKIVGFDKAFEIEIEMMERVLNSSERQKQFDENVEKCHFNDSMNKQPCSYE